MNRLILRTSTNFYQDDGWFKVRIRISSILSLSKADTKTLGITLKIISRFFSWKQLYKPLSLWSF
ncbi:MAG: hypothetical protein ACI956_000949 [Nonlabens sp.]